MRNLTHDELKEIDKEGEMLKDIGYKMCITHSFDVLNDLCDIALKSVRKIYEINKKRFDDER